MKTHRFTTRSFIKSLALAGLATLAASGAQAAVPGYYDFLPAWDQAAVSCAVDDSSTAHFESSYSTLGFKASSTATNLWAWCHVTNPLDTGNPDGVNGRPGWNGLIAGFTDPDGRDAGANVNATLFRLNRATGGFTSLAAFNSNTNGLNQTTWQEGLKTFSTKLDFLNSDYYVLINLSRTSTALRPSITAVRIAPVSKIPG